MLSLAGLFVVMSSHYDGVALFGNNTESIHNMVLHCKIITRYRSFLYYASTDETLKGELQLQCARMKKHTHAIMIAAINLL